MGILSSKIDFKILEECEKHVSQIDKQAFGLGECVDSVHTTVAFLLKLNTESGYASSRNNDECVKVLKDLLGSIERNLCSQKLAFLEALNGFASFLLKNKDAKSDNIRALKDLSIDKYLKAFVQKQTSYSTPDSGHPSEFSANDGAVPGKKCSIAKKEENQQKTTTGLNKEMTQGLENINRIMEERKKLINRKKDAEAEFNNNDEKLKSEIQRIIMISQEESSKIKHLEDQNRNLSEEIDALKTSKEELEHVLKDKSVRVSNLQTEVNALKESNLKLIDQLTPKTEIIKVQIFMQRKVDLLSSIESDLLRLISKHPMFENKELAIVRPESPDEIHGNHPTLILCLHGSRLGTDAKSEVQNIKEPGKTALLIFHYKDEHALPSQTSDGILTAAEFRALGGIFDLAFQKEKGIYDCNMNNTAASSIIKFILNSNSKCRMKIY